MNLTLTVDDISSLSPAARAELAALLFPKDTSNIPEGFTPDDFEDVVDLSFREVESFMAGCSETTIAGLKIFAQNGPKIHASLLNEAGIDNYGNFQGSITKRTRTVTKEQDAFLLTWDNWQSFPDNVGHYAVTTTTYNSLRQYFQLD